MKIWLFELPIFYRILFYVAYWASAQIGVGILAAYLPLSWIKYLNNLFIVTSFESFIIGKYFGVRKWKNRLPEGATWFKRNAFRKDKIQHFNDNHLKRYTLESIRGELSHWITLVFLIPLYYLSLPWVFVVHILYALAVNLPCMLSLRFNRYRIRLLIKKRDRKLLFSAN